MAVVVLGFVVLVGPLAYFFGADSRPTSKANRSWFAGRPRRS